MLDTITYRGCRIAHDPESGYHGWEIRGNEEFGYADSVEDIKAEIDDYLAGPSDSRARQAIGWE